MDTEAAAFRVLLAEDDAVSREFLGEAIRACGASVTECADGSSALAHARAEAWNLLVLDHQLPGLNGDAILAALRAEPDAASHAAPAVATSAASDTVATALLQAGFSEVLPKPLELASLRAALRRHGLRTKPLDDDDALRACGSPEAVARLRRLFAEQELPTVQEELERLRDDPQALRPTLHRLRASCGFCGAHALATASAGLHRTLTVDADAARVQAALDTFRTALAETRAALHANLGETATPDNDMPDSCTPTN